MFEEFLCAVALATLSVAGASARDASHDTSKVTLVFDHALPNVPGESMKGVLVEYQPGHSSPQGNSKNASLSEGDGVEAVFGEGLADGGERSLQRVGQAQGCVAQGGERLGSGS